MMMMMVMMMSKKFMVHLVGSDFALSRSFEP
jgi:hypothetical protein